MKIPSTIKYLPYSHESRYIHMISPLMADIIQTSSLWLVPYGFVWAKIWWLLIMFQTLKTASVGLMPPFPDTHILLISYKLYANIP